MIFDILLNRYHKCPKCYHKYNKFYTIAENEEDALQKFRNRDVSCANCFLIPDGTVTPSKDDHDVFLKSK